MCLSIYIYIYIYIYVYINWGLSHVSFHMISQDKVEIYIFQIICVRWTMKLIHSNPHNKDSSILEICLSQISLK